MIRRLEWAKCVGENIYPSFRGVELFKLGTLKIMLKALFAIFKKT